MKIGIDIDDTITNSTKTVKKYLKLYGKKYSDEETLMNNINDIIRGFFVNEAISAFFSDYSLKISSELEVKEDAVEIINKLKEEGNEIIIITARSNNYYKDVDTFCKEFLDSKGIKYDKLITGQKYKIEACKKEKIDIMFDDAVDTCEDINKNGIEAILFNSEINENIKTDCKRISTWKEVYDYIHSKN